jgi:hypothetical protein
MPLTERRNMDQTISDFIQVKVSNDTFISLSVTKENPNYISMSPWQHSVGHGVTTFDKDTAIQLANRLLDLAGSGNK